MPAPQVVAVGGFPGTLPAAETVVTSFSGPASHDALPGHVMYEPSVKRARMDFSESPAAALEAPLIVDRLPLPPIIAQPPQAQAGGMRVLEEENHVLRRKVDELKKQVTDLAAANELLLEQVAQFRAVSKSVSAAHPAVVTVTMQ